MVVLEGVAVSYERGIPVNFVAPKAWDSPGAGVGEGGGDLSTGFDGMKVTKVIRVIGCFAYRKTISLYYCAAILGVVSVLWNSYVEAEKATSTLTTRRSTTLSSKVNLSGVVDFSALFGAKLITHRP